MNRDGLTTMLAQLEAGTLGWEQALALASKPTTAWQVADYKQRGANRKADRCVVCATTAGPFLIQPRGRCIAFKKLFHAVMMEFHAKLLPRVAGEVTLAAMTDRLGPGEPRLACPACGSVSIQRCKTGAQMYRCLGCARGPNPTPTFSAPTAMRYYAPHRTTSRCQALAHVRRKMLAAAMEAALGQERQAIHHEATRRYLQRLLDHRSPGNTAIYCRACAFYAKKCAPHSEGLAFLKGDHQDRAVGPGNDLVGGAAQQQARQAGAGVGAHHQ